MFDTFEKLMNIDTTTCVLQRQIIQEIDLMRKAGIPNLFKYDLLFDWLIELREEDLNPKQEPTQEENERLRRICDLELKLILGTATDEEGSEYTRLKVLHGLG